MQAEQLKKEVSYKTSRSSGKGGQHVNKTETKVTLVWDVMDSALFSGQEKELLLMKLANRINQEGELLVVAQKERSQLRNKKLAFERLTQFLETALKLEKDRIPTKTPKRISKARLEQKKRTSEKKASRKKVKRYDQHDSSAFSIALA